MSNDSYSNTSLSQETTLDDVIVVTIWTILLTYGLIANCLIQVGILRSSNMRGATSYWLILSLSMCDVVMILISLLHLVPSTALHDRYVEIKSARNIWVIFFYDLFWYTGVLKLGLMAANRFASIVYPMDYQRLFSRKRTVYIIAAVYFLGLIVSIPTLFPCCHTIWDHHQYVTYYDPIDSPYFIVDILVNSVSVVVMAFCYTVILVKVRESRQAMSKYRMTMKRVSAANLKDPNRTNGKQEGKQEALYRPLATPPRASVSKREMRLFVQFFIVSLVFLLTWSTWQWLPRIEGLEDSKWLYFAMTSFFFVNNGVNPTVYLIFNSTLRREVRTVLHLGSVKQPQHGTGTGHSPSNEGQLNGAAGAGSSTGDPSRPNSRQNSQPNSPRLPRLHGGSSTPASRAGSRAGSLKGLSSNKGASSNSLVPNINNINRNSPRQSATEMTTVKKTVSAEELKSDELDPAKTAAKRCVIETNCDGAVRRIEPPNELNLSNGASEKKYSPFPAGKKIQLEVSLCNSPTKIKDVYVVTSTV